MTRQDSSTPYQGIPDRPLQTQPTAAPPPVQPPVPGAPPSHGGTHGAGGDLSLNLRPGSRTTSAPSSPAKTRESLLQRVQSLTGAARDQGASILGAAVGGASRGSSYNKDRCFTLLVIDDQNTDWSKYFRGRRLHGDYEIRVEQAEFRELSLTANETGATVSMAVFRNGTKVIRSFKPDFALIRQNLRDAGEDYKSILLGLMYGSVPSVNNLTAIYNFQDKPWVFAHLIGLQRRLGKDNFPLIDQTFYPNHREMVSAPRYPVVVKLGHAHGGVGKARAENNQEFADIASLAALTTAYITAEPYIDTKYDVHVQKIGNNYKAFMRKSISGNWKSNTGSAMLEQLAVTERHRSWIDHVAQLFGGLDICAIELLVAKDGREYIIEVNDSALSLMGDSQEEDRRQIADLVTAKMQVCCRPHSVLTKTTSRGSMSGASQTASPVEERGPPSGPAPVLGSHGSITSMTSIGSMGSVSSTPAHAADITSSDSHQQLQRRDSQVSQSSTVSTAASISRRSDEPPPLPPSRTPFHRQGSQSQVPTGEDTEDTMKNLRKTFAGIFGEM
ncbi:synapsin [Chelonus insularis]|uniref:synapsin n=1 Tax=Chelonus insularis TaxID=460826 RepID=UPI0015888250|nr:synapsin [Chelonus insularis]XP_034940897.1 synapsin [Chelonus insularis]XP_034940906.1 synapsin [Chelonus insularis]XP_034940915.1 synapsin [Chelonus insularis]XP_034940926.1 synapsin [Chelonus insularis]